MSKPNKLQYNGDSKVIKYLTTCVNWILDNISSVIGNPSDTPTDTLTSIEIDGTVYAVSGGGIPANPEITKVYDNETSGSTTYTILKDGLYLIINSYSYDGTHSVSLPSGRLPIVTGYVGNYRGMTWDVVELKKDDVVTIVNTPSSWDAFSKVIYYLKDIDVTSFVESDIEDDSTVIYTPPTTGRYLMVGVGMGRTSNDYRNDTDTTGCDCLIVEGDVGVNTTIGLYYGDGDKLPTAEFYGYDGGCGCVALFRAKDKSGILEAKDVSYDNTDSGIDADNVQGAIDELADEKVDKVVGKGLSTNDFTDTLKDKLDGIEANPSNTATDDLTKIKIDGTTYNVSSLPFQLVVDESDNGINIVYDDSILNGGGN